MRQRTRYRVKYRFDYPSGKSYTDQQDVTALTKYGAEETIRWIYAQRTVTILSVQPLYQVGAPIYPDPQVIGDF